MRREGVRTEVRLREYEQRFGKNLDEDVKIGVILALAPPQGQNHCHLNSHILRSYAQVRTMLFDHCRAQADTAAVTQCPLDLCVLVKGDKERQRQEQRQRQNDGVLCRIWSSLQSLETHGEGLLVERKQQIVFKPHKTSGRQQKLAVNWLGFNARTGEHIVSNNAPVTSCRSIRRRNKEERWNRDMLLGILGNPGPARRTRGSRSQPCSTSWILSYDETGPTTTKTRNEEDVRHIYITKRMVSDIGLQGVPAYQTTTHRGVPIWDHHTDGKRSYTSETSRRKLDQESGVRQSRAGGCCTE